MIPRKYLILLAMVGMLVAFDQLTKLAIISNFYLGQSLPVLEGYFNITRIHNTGMAFGIFADHPSENTETVLLLLPLLTLAVILFIFFKLRNEQRLSTYALSMIVGGALGNMADRLRLGYVVDFLDFHWQLRMHFPAFNVADAAITLGVGLLMLSLFFEKIEGDSKDVERAPS